MVCEFAEKTDCLVLGVVCRLDRSYCCYFDKPELVACCPALKKRS
jgi:hypothetical protein